MNLPNGIICSSDNIHKHLTFTGYESLRQFLSLRCRIILNNNTIWYASQWPMAYECMMIHCNAAHTLARPRTHTIVSIINLMSRIKPFTISHFKCNWHNCSITISILVKNTPHTTSAHETDIRRT